MSTITLPNIRVSSDLEIRLKLKDGGVAIDWTTLSNIKASIYSDRQRSLAGRCDIAIDEEDSTILVCRYSANKPQYPGVNRVIVCCTYDGETKTYDKPAFTFVRWTDDQAGQSITIDDPDIDVEITVEDVSSSILQEAVEAAFTAAERADEAAAAAEHMVDIHTGPAGKSAYEVAVDEGFVGTEEEWLASLEGPVGETPDISIGTVTTVEPGTPAAATMTGTPENPVLNLTIPKGVAGDTPNFTVGEVTTGEPGTPVVVTITGTAAAPVLNITIPQGLQGNTGSSVEYPFELVNNCTTNDATKAATAAVAKGLKDELTQLEHKKADKDTVRAYMMTDRAKYALLDLFDKVAFAVPDVSAEVAELNTALFNLDEVVGVEATYDQGKTIWDQGVSSLDDLKVDLTVKAVYGDGTKVKIQNYTLSGTLTAGTSTITVTYLGFIDTFDVTVTVYGSKMSYVLSEMVNLVGKATDNQNSTYGWALTDNAARQMALLNYGYEMLRNQSDGSLSGYYGIPVPKTATKITVSISQNALQIGGYLVWFDGVKVKLHNSTVYSWAAGGFTANFTQDGTRQVYYLPVSKPSSGNYPSGQPTALTIDFE